MSGYLKVADEGSMGGEGVIAAIPEAELSMDTVAGHHHDGSDSRLGENSHAQNTDTDLNATFEATFEKVANKGAASGYASLSAGTLVVENPANATATPTASKIPIADGSGKLDGWVSSSSTTVSGITEAAIASEVTTGTDAARAVTPDALAGSDYGKRVVEVALNSSTALAVTDKAYFRTPAVMNGYNLVAVAAMVKVASTAGAITLTVKNGATSMLSTNITIDQDEFDTLTAATPAVIDAAQDDVATGEQIEVACSGAGASATYCVVELTFQLP